MTHKSDLFFDDFGVCVLIPHISDIQYSSFSDVLSRSTHVVTQFKWLTNVPLYKYMCMYISHNFIHSSIRGRLSCFSVLANVSNAAVNMGVQISFRVGVFVGVGRFKFRSQLDECSCINFFQIDLTEIE